MIPGGGEARGYSVGVIVVVLDGVGVGSGVAEFCARVGVKIGEDVAVWEGAKVEVIEGISVFVQAAANRPKKISCRNRFMDSFLSIRYFR
jgi:hypothetical protein